MLQDDGSRSLIIIPTYNERENIADLLVAIRDRLADVHILVVDDNSPDGTGSLVLSLAGNDEHRDRLHLLPRKAKEGLGPAYIAGFRWALARNYEVIVSMDADFSHDPGYLPEMLARLEDADVVVGSRYVAGGGTENWSWTRRMLSRLGGVYARMILGVPVSDMTAGFNAYRRAVLETMLFDEFQLLGFGFQLEMKYRAHQNGFRFVELPIVFPDRERGVSKMSGSIALEALLKVWQLRLSGTHEGADRRG